MRQVDQTTSILALLVVATVTEAMLLLLPVYVGAISDGFSFSEQQIGLLSSADLLGIALSTVSAVWWLRRVSWKPTVFVLILLFFIANSLSLIAESFAFMFLIRFFAGLSCGAAYAVALAGLCDSSKSERNAALMVCGQVIFGALGSYILPIVSVDWQLSAIYFYMNIWGLVALVLIYLFFPDRPQANQNLSTGKVHFSLPRASAVILGTFAYFLAIGMVWAYLERLAREAGLDSESVATSLGFGYLISLIGSFGAAWLGNRLGKAIPMMVAGSAQLMMLFLFSRLAMFENAAMAFFLINVVFQFFWSYIIAYQIVIYSDVDRTRGFVATYGTFMHLALAAGPFIGSMLIREGSYIPIIYAGMGALSICYLSFLAAVFLANREMVAANKEVSI